MLSPMKNQGRKCDLAISGNIDIIVKGTDRFALIHKAHLLTKRKFIT
jgi:hypothetical protein